jgi:hypothetical protein
VIKLEIAVRGKRGVVANDKSRSGAVPPPFERLKAGSVPHERTKLTKKGRDRIS